MPFSSIISIACLLFLIGLSSFYTVKHISWLHHFVAIFISKARYVIQHISSPIELVYHFTTLKSFLTTTIYFWLASHFLFRRADSLFQVISFYEQRGFEDFASRRREQHIIITCRRDMHAGSMSLTALFDARHAHLKDFRDGICIADIAAAIISKHQATGCRFCLFALSAFSTTWHITSFIASDAGPHDYEKWLPSRRHRMRHLLAVDFVT